MIYSTAAVPVNPGGETKLTRAQIWQGLELKARDARLFLHAGPLHPLRRRGGARDPLPARSYDRRC